MHDSMRRRLPAALVAAAFLLGLLAYGHLPERVPIHWGLDGRPDGWAGRPFGAFGAPAIMLAAWGVLRAAPAIDPRADNYARFARAYDLIVGATLTLLLVMHAGALASAVGLPVSVPRLAPAVVGLFLMAVGNVLPRVRPNWFVGIRTPWTLESDAVWARTQRVAGYLFVGAGALFLLAAAVPGRRTATAALVGTVGAAVVSVVYSALRGTRS